MKAIVFELPPHIEIPKDLLPPPKPKKTKKKPKPAPKKSKPKLPQLMQCTPPKLSNVSSCCNDPISCAFSCELCAVRLDELDRLCQGQAWYCCIFCGCTSGVHPVYRRCRLCDQKKNWVEDVFLPQQCCSVCGYHDKPLALSVKPQLMLVEAEPLVDFQQQVLQDKTLVVCCEECWAKHEPIEYEFESSKRPMLFYHNLIEKLMAGHCSMCRRPYDMNYSYLWDWDHVDAFTKEAAVSWLCSYPVSKELVDLYCEEKKKCRLLCRNCHTHRSAIQFETDFMLEAFCSEEVLKCRYQSTRCPSFSSIAYYKGK